MYLTLTIIPTNYSIYKNSRAVQKAESTNSLSAPGLRAQRHYNHPSLCRPIRSPLHLIFPQISNIVAYIIHPLTSFQMINPLDSW